MRPIDPAFEPLVKTKDHIPLPFCGAHLYGGKELAASHACDLPHHHTGPHRCNCMTEWGNVKTPIQVNQELPIEQES